MKRFAKLAAWLFLVGVLSVQPLAVPSAQAAEVQRTLQVRGVGSIEVVPDMATISFRLSALRETAAAAQEANAANLAALERVLKEFGIGERDIRTRSVTLREEWEYTNNQRVFKGYRAEQVIAVTVNDIGLVGKILDGVIAASGATVDGVDFGLKDRTAAEREALREAYEHAASRARVLAEMAGITLGVPSRIVDETSVAAPKLVALDAAFMRSSAAFEASTQVYPGTIVVEAQVYLEFTY